MQLIRLSLALTLLCLVPAEIAAALLSKTNKHSHADFVEAEASEFQAKEKNFVLVLREMKATTFLVGNFQRLETVLFLCIKKRESLVKSRDT